MNKLMKTIVDEQPHTKMVSSVRWKVALAFSAFILIGANDGALGVILPSLRRYYHVDTATVGLLFLASTFGYAVSSFNNGFLIEKLGKRLFLMMGAAIFLLGAMIFSLLPPYFLTFVAALLLGF